MLEKLSEIICNYVEVDPENIKEDSRFMEDLGFTSFDFMSLLGELEDEFVPAHEDKSYCGEQNKKLDYNSHDGNIHSEDHGLRRFLR